MPPTLSKPSFAVRAAVLYITLGALLVVWTVVWFLYLSGHGGSDAAYFTDYGLFFSGLVLIVIGITIGRIGRSARHAELPPEVRPTAGATPTALPPGYTMLPPYLLPGVPPTGRPGPGRRRPPGRAGGPARPLPALTTHAPVGRPSASRGRCGRASWQA
jgi:hypothetical protein